MQERSQKGSIKETEAEKALKQDVKTFKLELQILKREKWLNEPALKKWKWLNELARIENEFNNLKETDPAYKEQLNKLFKQLKLLSERWDQKFKLYLQILKKDHKSDAGWSQQLALLEEEFNSLKATATTKYLEEACKLYRQLEQLSKNWNTYVLEHTQGTPQGVIYDNERLQRNLETYNRFFDWWQKSRDERTAYNQFFLKLLFVSTLIAILTPLLATTGITAFTPLVLVVLLSTISYVWFLKLWTLWQLECGQRDMLQLMEEALLIPVKMVAGWHMVSNERLSVHDNSRIKTNYYMLPVLMAVVFALLFVSLITLVFLHVIPFSAAPAKAILLL
jgi:hypothetical protein